MRKTQNSFYNISKGQLIILWCLGIIMSVSFVMLSLVPLLQDELLDFIRMFIVYPSLTIGFLIFYTLGWKHEMKYKSSVACYTEKTTVIILLVIIVILGLLLGLNRSYDCKYLDSSRKAQVQSI